MTPISLLGLLTLVIGVPLNAYVTFLLWHLRGNPPSRALRVLGVVFTSLTLLALVFGLVFVNNDLPDPPFSSEVTKYLTRIAMIAAVTLPAIVLLAWIRGSNEGSV